MAQRARRAELAKVRHRLDVLTDRRLLGPWTDDEAIEYAVMSMREYELLAQRPQTGVRRAAGRSPGSAGWAANRRQA